MTDDPRIAAVPDIHGHAKGEHKSYVDERPIPYTARMLFLWFFHACRRGAPRFLMVADHINYLTFEDPAAVNLVRRALKLAQAGDLYGAAETAGVEVAHASVVGDGLRRGMRYSIGAEVDNDPRSRPDAQNIVDAMRPDGIVRSIHFLPIAHPQFGENWMWPFDNPEFRDLYDVVGTDQTWELYMATLLDAVEKLPGHIVGHFYVPGKFGHWPADDVLESYEDRLLDACAERGMAVEINARTFYKHAVGDEAQLEKYRAVNLRLLRKAKEKGVAVAVGSDAHSPKDQGRGFGEVLALLDEAEVNEIAFPIDGRMARVALRATDELRQASARRGGAKDQTEIAIPGTEEPESVPDALPEPVAVAAANEPGAAPVSAAAPKKRPSRAKKPAAVASEPGAAPLVATAPEAVTPPAPKIAVQASSAPPEEPAVVAEDAAAEVSTAPQEAPAEATTSAEQAALEPEPAEVLPEPVASSEDAPETLAPQAAIPERFEETAAEPPAAETVAAGADEDSSTAAGSPEPSTAAAAEPAAPVTSLAAAAAAVASAAVAAVASLTKRRAPQPSREAAQPVRAEPPKPARPAKPQPASKPSKPDAAASSAVAATPAATPKRGAKAAKPVVARGTATAKASSSPAKASSVSAKSLPAAAKKRVVAKAVAKKSTPTRATAPAAKKAAPKKSAAVRKPVSKGASKTASRVNAKKTSAKKTVKKKTTKQRR